MTPKKLDVAVDGLPLKAAKALLYTYCALMILPNILLIWLVTLVERYEYRLMMKRIENQAQEDPMHEAMQQAENQTIN